MSEEKTRTSSDSPRDKVGPILPTVNPDVEKAQPSKPGFPPAVYVVIWITLSSSVILFNKWILDSLKFPFPVFLTTYHLTFATVMTQILARYTTLLDGRHSVKMTGRVYLRAILPIGFFFSLSLICGNITYLYLSVAFIQMLKATMPVAVLIAGWSLGVSQLNLKVFLNVSVIVVGVVLASFGEIKFVWVGVLWQIGGIVFESLRLTMVQRILSSADFKMDPMVSLYYFAPICSVMNGIVALVWEVPNMSMDDIYRVGLITLFLNGLCAFLLNVSVVFLIGKTSGLVLTLCGVLKDIMLVVASMIIWGTQVTALQFFGYSVALGGMVYYKLGYETFKTYAGEGSRQWADFGNRRPILRRLTTILLGLLTVFILLGGVAPTYGADFDPIKYLSDVKNKMGMAGA